MKKNKTLKTLSILLLTLCAIPAWGQCTPSSAEDGANIVDESTKSCTQETFEELKQRPPLSEMLRGCTNDFYGCTPYSNRFPYLDTELLLEFKEELLEHITPETFYLWLANAPISEHKSEALAWILENGFDINYSEFEPPYMVELNALEYSLYFLLANKWLPQQHAKHEQMLELLLEHNATCAPHLHKRWKVNALNEFLEHPEKIIEKQYQYLIEKPPVSDTPKIPYILHHIWLTHPDAPNEMRPQDIAQAIANKRLLEKTGKPWQCIVWVNDRALFPESIKALEQEGITVQSIDTHEGELSNYSSILAHIELKKWGIASDVLRLSLLERFGGVYTDINYVIERDLTPEMHMYDFFSYDYNLLEIQNCFIASKPGHPILIETNNIVASNLGTNQPDYIRKIQAPNSYTVAIAFFPLMMGYLKEANEHGTADAIFSFHSKDEPTGEHKDWRKHYTEKYPALISACPSEIVEGYLFHNHPNLPKLEPFGHDGWDGQTWIE